MLINHLKQLINLVRSTKKPPTHIPVKNTSKQNQQKGFSHPISPTLKKIDQQYKDQIKKQQKQQEELIKSFGQLKNSIFQKNQLEKFKINKKIIAQTKIDNLQIPANLKENFLSTQNQSQSIFSTSQKNQFPQINIKKKKKAILKQINPKQIKSVSNKKNIQIFGKDIHSISEANRIKKMAFKQQQNPFQEQILKQQILINQILKDKKQKQAQLNLPQDWKKQLNQKKKQQKEQKQLLNQKIRYQKLKQISQQSFSLETKGKSIKKQNFQMKKLNMLDNQLKIQISPDEIWRDKYSPELIQKAMNYKNKELHYFKELIQGTNRDKWDIARESTIVKLSKEQKEKRKKNRELINTQKQKQQEHLGTSLEKTQQQGITRYKDLEYYKEKALKQFQETQNIQNYDIELKKASEKDIDQYDRLNQLYMMDYEDEKERKLDRRDKYEASTFGKYDLKLKQLSQRMTNLGIDCEIEDLAKLNKQLLFADKKLQQQNASYQQYLLKKQKKKQMKQELNKIHKEQLRHDLNFDYQINPTKLDKLNPIDMEEGLKKIQQIKKLKQSTIVSADFLKQKIHHIKTLKAMTQFITGYFYRNIENPNNNITDKVQIGNIIPNRKNTVLNIFWQFNPNYLKVMKKYKFNENDFEKEKETLQAKLQKQAKYISSKMTEFLQLRYGPDIRFIFNLILDQTKKQYEEMKKCKNQIIQFTLQEYREKGLIKAKENQADYKSKIQHIINSNLEDLNNQKILVSKTFKKKKKLQQKLKKREQRKENKKLSGSFSADANQQFQIKRRLSQKQLADFTLQQLINQKVQAKKKSIFTSRINSQTRGWNQKSQPFSDDDSASLQTQNGIKQEIKVQKKLKRSPVERLWDQISQKGT